MLPIAVLAGGLATRLRPITDRIPKSLVEVAGRPFIDWQLEAFSQQGIERIVVCTGYLGEMVQDHIGDGARFGLEVLFSPDGPRLLGTGGALRQAAPLLGEQFAVVYGDSFLPIGFEAVEQAFRSSHLPALMSVLKNQDCWDKSNVLFRNEILVEYNKSSPRPEMAFIDYGLGYLTTKTLLEYNSGEPFDLSDLYHKLSIQNLLGGYEVHDRFYEIGSIQGLRETENYLISRK